MTLEGDIFQPSGLLTGGSRKYASLYVWYILIILEKLVSEVIIITSLFLQLPFYTFRGGGELLKQLHASAEAESELKIHQRKLSVIEEKAGFLSFILFYFFARSIN